MRATREKCEELAMTMEFLEGGAIRTLKSHLRKYYDDHENEELRNNVESEVTTLIELADQNRADEGILDGMANEEEQKDQKESDDRSKYGHLIWLDKLINLSDPENADIVT